MLSIHYRDRHLKLFFKSLLLLFAQALSKYLAR